MSSEIQRRAETHLLMADDAEFTRLLAQLSKQME